MADVMSPPPPLQPSEPEASQVDENAKVPQPPTNCISTPTTSNSARRLPRKSTLTQQQRNQKRQRATQDQLMTLEIEFGKNPTPTALVRERIAQDINMTERSVQIWFQNRRAKIKNIAKRTVESSDEYDSIPDTMRQYLAMQAFGPGGKGLPPSILGRAGVSFGPYGAGTLCLKTDASSGKVAIQNLACRSLSIGTWRRVGQSTMDLVIFYSPEETCITYYINNDSAGYKIEYPFAWIKNIMLDKGDLSSAAEGASQRAGGLVIELMQPPKFYMDSGHGFYECGDFTEDQQASLIMIHHLGGPAQVLSGQLARLVSLDSYQHRHHAFNPNFFAVSAPVSPMRPASQPNHMLHPHFQPPTFQFDHAPGLMGPPAPRGHKRQRSRSVPAAIDFSMLRHPMPSFLIQHTGQPTSAALNEPPLFAPIPQHHGNPFAPGPGASNLSIDTSGFGMAMQYPGPMSATTINSPSDFGTPGFFASGPAGEPMAPAQFHTPFHHGMLNVDQAAMIGTSNTPLSIASHGDPLIADHSPPLLGRSQSADIFGTPGEHSHFGDEGLYLSESFNKQIALPFRSPSFDDTFHSPMPDGPYNFQSPPGTSDGSQALLPMQMPFQSPPHQTDDGSMVFQSPPGPTQINPQHSDSGVSFSTGSNMSQDQTTAFDSPKDSNGMVYQDSKVFASPGQMQPQLADENSMYPTTTGDERDMNNFVMYVDPSSLGQPPPH